MSPLKAPFRVSIRSSVTLSDKPSCAMNFSRIRKFRFERPQQFAALLSAHALWRSAFGSSTARRSPIATMNLRAADGRCGRSLRRSPATSPVRQHPRRNTRLPRCRATAYHSAHSCRAVASETSTWEARHQLGYVLLLMRLPFVFAGPRAGRGAVVGDASPLRQRRRLCRAGPLLLFSGDHPRLHLSEQRNSCRTADSTPPSIPPSEWPMPCRVRRHKWRPRIVLLTPAFGFTAAAHVCRGYFVAFLLAFLFLVIPCGGPPRLHHPHPHDDRASGIAAAALRLLFRFSRTPSATSFAAEQRGIWLLTPARPHLLLSVPQRRCHARCRGSRAGSLSRHTPLALLRQHHPASRGPAALSSHHNRRFPSQPWLWAIPFLLTFIGGVFADVLESRHRRVFLFATGGLLLAQAALSLAALPMFARVNCKSARIIEVTRARRLALG